MRSWRNGSLKAIAAVSVLFAFTLKAQDSKTEKAVSYLTENQCSEGFWNQDLQKQLVDSLESFHVLQRVRGGENALNQALRYFSVLPEQRKIFRWWRLNQGISNELGDG